MSRPLPTRTALVLALTAVLNCAALAADKPAKTERRLFDAKERATISLHFEQEQRDRELYAQYHEQRAHEQGAQQNGKHKDKNKNKGLPPGLQKKAASGRLPPGWEKKLQRGQVLSTEIYALAEPLPPRLVAQLPPLPAGSITVHIEGKIVRLLEATHEIIDVLDL